MAVDTPTERSAKVDNDELLLASAIEVFAERGYDNAGVAEIARRAGLTTGAIYSRYRGKAELLLAALEAEMAAHLEAMFRTSDDTSPTGMLAALGSNLLDPKKNVAQPLFLEAVVAARRDPDLAAMLQQALDTERTRVSEVIDHAKADGLFDADLDTGAVLAFVQSIGLGFLIFRAIGTPMPDADAWQVVIDRVIAAALPPTHP